MLTFTALLGENSPRLYSDRYNSARYACISVYTCYILYAIQV